MSETPNLEITFGLSDPELEDEEKLNFAQKLLSQLRDCDQVETVDRTEDLNPEIGSRSGFATIIGFLTAEVSIKNITAFAKFLGERIGDKSLKIKVKMGDNEVELEAKSSQELKQLEEVAHRLMDGMARNEGVNG
jgi:hypothetical protein